MQRREALAVGLMVTALFPVSTAVDARRAWGEVRAPMLMENVRTPEIGQRIKIRRKASLDPRSDVERDIDTLDARIRLLWAKVERLETKLLKQRQEDKNANA